MKDEGKTGGMGDGVNGRQGRRTQGDRAMGKRSDPEEEPLTRKVSPSPALPVSPSLLHPSSFILHPSSFILPPSSFPIYSTEKI
jgi:hypothetical protein